jgi:hypothetical protein
MVGTGHSLNVAVAGSCSTSSPDSSEPNGAFAHGHEARSDSSSRKAFASGGPGRHSRPHVVRREYMESSAARSRLASRGDHTHPPDTKRRWIMRTAGGFPDSLSVATAGKALRVRPVRKPD